MMQVKEQVRNRQSPLRARAAALALAVWAIVGGPPGLSAQEPAPAPPNLTGDWLFSVVTENGTGTPDVRLLHEGEALSGSYASARMGARSLEGTVRGDSILFRLETDPEAGVVMTFIGAVQADGTLAGIVDFGGFGGATFTARRRPPEPDSQVAIRNPKSGVQGVHATQNRLALVSGVSLRAPRALVARTAMAPVPALD